MPLAALAVLALLSPASSAPWWQAKKVASFWYAPDNDWPQAVALVAAHALANVSTSVMSYCGLDIRDDGTIVPAFSPVCASLLPALRAVGVEAELVTNSGNCSIAAMRRLWADLTVSPRVLGDAVRAAAASGLNIDFEPQADNCKGAPTGDAADAVAFAAWLGAVRAAVAPARLTVDVASWSPVLREYATLARGVDRLLDMSTYNGASEADFETQLDPFLAGAPLAPAGVGLGAWQDAAPAWWSSAAGAAAKVAACVARRVPELALFRIDVSVTPVWPLEHWWAALAPFLQAE